MSVTHSLFGFKTAYLQKEELLDVAVCSSESGDKFKVGQMCVLTPASGSTPAYITKSTTASDGYYILAQSDETVQYGHIPVEYRDYRYTDEVALTVSASQASDADASKVKKVALYKVINASDIVSL